MPIKGSQIWLYLSLLDTISGKHKMVKVDVQSFSTQEAKLNDESMLKGSVVMGPKPDKSPGYESWYCVYS